jgi:hypothetical protein
MHLDEALKLLKRGTEGIAEWNRRRDAGAAIPDLNGADLSGADLIGANLSRADLSRAKLGYANLNNANFHGAELSYANLNNANLHAAEFSYANLSRADLSRAKLGYANLNNANLHGAELSYANLNNANLSGTKLSQANLHGAELHGAELSEALCDDTAFANVDLSDAKGLDSVNHFAPSTVGTDTIFRSRGKTPEAFLRGCGVPEALIEYLPSLIGATQPIQFYSCFISYSTKDEEFAKRLHARMLQEKLRVWFAPEDIQGGKHIHEQIDRAIQVHDRLLLVLSTHSMNSNWVRHEVRRARKTELKENRRKLFPIRLVDFETIMGWEYPDADLGEDLAIELRRYFIPDFSNWRDHDAFEAGFSRLVRDLKAEETKGATNA